MSDFLNSSFVKWCQTPWINGMDNDKLVCLIFLGIDIAAIAWLAFVKKVKFF